MDFIDKQIAPPRSWETFEDLTRALFAYVWNDPLTQKNGRTGQAQAGVDVYLNPSQDCSRVFGIQCKGKDALYGAKATVAEFDAELAKAESFEPKLSRWIFATTAANDAELQKHARKVTQARVKQGKFPVHIMGWESIQALLHENRSVAQQFYPEHIMATGDTLALLNSASTSALKSIDDSLVHGDVALSLVRQEIWSDAHSALDHHPIVRLTGEGGTGKSAILRRLGLGFSGLVLLLKDSEISSKSWQEFATTMGAPESCSTVVELYSATGPCLLLIDGADRLLLSDRRSVVTEILREIAESPFFEKWKVVTSARNYQGQDVVSSALKEVGFVNLGEQVFVGNLSQKEAVDLGFAFPEFANMLRREDLSGQNRTLFLLRELFQRESAPTDSFTEMDLAAAWATRAGSNTAATANRSHALSQLGTVLMQSPGRRPGRGEIDPVGLQCLIDEGAITIDARRDAISLSFDVHEDWLLARSFERERDKIQSIIEDAGEPLWWMRAIRLTGQLLLEAHAYDDWVSLLAQFDAADGLDPAWSRSLLVAPLYSEKSASILDELHAVLLADEACLLARLLETLQVFESRIDEGLLNSPALADMGETERYRLLAYLKQPQWPSWVPFMKWSLQHWERWPKKLIPKLSEVAKQWARATEHMPNAHSQEMARICYRWLQEIENANQPKNWDERREPFDHKLPNYRDWEKVEDRLREVLILSVESAKPTTKAYLERLAQNGSLRSAREKLLEAPHRVPSALPKEWVEVCLQQFVPPRKRVRHGGNSIIPDQLFSWHEYNDAGIRGNNKFFPSSPLRAGFSQLFETDETEALRLFHRMERRAAVFWRWYSKCEDRKTPEPLLLEMPWGDIPLWGDETVYRWCSGVLGSNVLGSAYLALDDWLHNQIAAGRSIEELLRLVLQPHGLVATASPCIAVFHDQVNSPGALDWCAPFLGEPRLWNYDIRRHLDRSDKAYRIGFMGRDDVYFEAVEKYHKRHSKYQPMSHAFLLPFRLMAGEDAQLAFDERRSRWAAEDLVEFREELDHPAIMAEHQERIDRCLSDSDPRQIEITEGEESNQITVQIKPPDKALAEIAALNEEQQRLSEASRLFGWVNATREKGFVDNSMTLSEGVGLAEELLANPQPPESSPFGSLGGIRSAGIVGTAAVAAHFGSRDFINSHRAWIDELLIAGARFQRSREDQQFLFDHSILPCDPQEYAAWGLPALASIEPFSNELDGTILALSVQRLNAVASAVLQGLRWDRRREFAWTVCIAALDCCVVDIGHFWRGDHEKQKAASRMTMRRKRAIDRGLKNRNLSRLPDLPPSPFKMQWIFTKEWKRPLRRLKMPSKTALDWTKAKELLDKMDWAAVSSSPERAALFSRYLTSLVEWTRSYSEDDPDRYDRQFPYEWGHALARYIGRYAAATGSTEEWKSLLAFTYRDRAEDLIGDYLDAVSHELMVTEREPDEKFWSAWASAADWVMENAVPKRRPSWNDTPHALQAAGFVGPYMTPIPPEWPYLSSLLPRIDQWQLATNHLPGAALSLLAIVERMDVAQRKEWYLVWLGRLVDANGSDESFWGYGGLGDKCAALVKVLSSEKDLDAVSVRRCLAGIADAGSAVARELIPRFSRSRPA